MVRMDPQVLRVLEGRRVLIVEDEMLVAMELEGLLQSEGCTALGPAPTVDRALQVLHDERPDAAVLDLNLRGTCASPVARALKEQGVPFVIVSGYAKAPSGRPELDEAVRVDKPVDHRLLVRRLAEALDRPAH